MNRIFKKEQVITIPNIYSIFRFLLIPVILWLYCFRKEYLASALLILLSGATDVIDGYIARRFQMITDLGKALDPVADKMTQGAVILCLVTRYPKMLYLIITFCVCEIVKFLFGLFCLNKNDSVNSAKWYGKVNTVLLYLSLVALILIPTVPTVFVDVATAVLCCTSVACLVLYIIFYLKLFAEHRRQRTAKAEN